MLATLPSPFPHQGFVFIDVIHMVAGFNDFTGIGQRIEEHARVILPDVTFTEAEVSQTPMKDTSVLDTWPDVCIVIETGDHRNHLDKHELFDSARRGEGEGRNASAVENDLMIESEKS